MQIRDNKPKSAKPADKPKPKPTVKKDPPKSSSPAVKKDPPKPKDEFVSTKKPNNYVPDRAVSGFRSSSRGNEMQHYAQSQKANVTVNKDGSVTRTSEHDHKGAHHTQELTTSKGKLLESHLKYTHSSDSHNGEKVTNTYKSDTDAAGRTRWTNERVRERTRQDGAQVTEKHAEEKDHWGIKRDVETKTVVTEKKNVTTTASETTSHDNRGNKLHSEDTTTVTKNANKTVTQNSQWSKGSQLTTNNSAKLDGGKFTLTDGADWKNGSSFEKSKYTETQYKPSTPADKSLGAPKTDKLGVVQGAGNALGAAGLKKEWSSQFNNIKENNTSTAPNTFVGTRVGTSGSQSLSVGADGVNASFNRTAQAGAYAEKSGSTTGKYGSASYTAQAKAEAIATVDAKGKLDTNGLDASLNAKVGVSVEASVTGRAETKYVKVGGVDMNASVDGTAKVSAEAKAEATGNVKVTRNPPSAIAEGTVGASAVVKIEGQVKASAGPFSVNASAYASAGAEAKATGVIGYSDGKLKIGGSVGAALGVGAGGSATVEVDVKMIGDVAKNTADVNKDGKLGIDDAKAAASAVVNKAGEVADKAKDKVLGWLGFGG